MPDSDYFGPFMNRAARVMAAGHGGQILLAASTTALADSVDLGDLVDLGERPRCDLFGTDQPIQIMGQARGADALTPS
jgi:class 3 adenylate cyclase